MQILILMQRSACSIRWRVLVLLSAETQIKLRDSSMFVYLLKSQSYGKDWRVLIISGCCIDN